MGHRWRAVFRGQLKAFQCPQRGYQEDEARLFTGVTGKRMREGECQLKQWSFMLNINKNLFIMRSVKQENRFFWVVCSLRAKSLSRPSWVKPWSAWSDLIVIPALSRRLDWSSFLHASFCASSKQICDKTFLSQLCDLLKLLQKMIACSTHGSVSKVVACSKHHLYTVDEKSL